MLQHELSLHENSLSAHLVSQSDEYALVLAGLCKVGGHGKIKAAAKSDSSQSAERVIFESRLRLERGPC